MDANIAALVIVSLQNFLQLYSLILIARILLTWFQTMGWAQQAIMFLSPVTDPYLNIFRSLIPPLGGIDFSPILAFLALSFGGDLIIGLLRSLLFSFA